MVNSQISHVLTSLMLLYALFLRRWWPKTHRCGQHFKTPRNKGRHEACRKRLGRQLRRIQLGFETSGGCEAAVHASRSYINSFQEKRALIKIDMKNAFNCIRKEQFRLLWQAFSMALDLFRRETWRICDRTAARGPHRSSPCFSWCRQGLQVTNQ